MELHLIYGCESGSYSKERSRMYKSMILRKIVGFDVKKW
jgi:hypothetical protein